MKRLADDTRSILMIVKGFAAGSYDDMYMVGEDGVTKIEVYEDFMWGDSSSLWFAIWKGDFLWRRTPAQGWDVEYSTETEGDGDA